MSPGLTEGPVAALLAALQRRTPIRQPVAVVVAHPDDETIGLGPLLPLFQDLLLVHVTDGAPQDRRDAEAAGFASCQEYAEARTTELERALATAAVDASRVALGIPDQQAAHRLPDLRLALHGLVAGASVVITHAFEGGHPDHDSVAFAVHAAGVPVIEMAGYHAAPCGGIEIGCFLDAGTETILRLSPEEQALRRRMLDCFVTQQTTLTPFQDAVALRLRAAPAYDFTRPAAKRAYYDEFPWGMTSAEWCALARDASR